MTETQKKAILEAARMGMRDMVCALNLDNGNLSSKEIVEEAVIYIEQAIEIGSKAE